MSTAVEEHIALRRGQKALRLADHLRTSGVSVDDAAHLSETEWRTVYAAAGTLWGSAATRRRAVSLLADSAHTPCPYCGTGDPGGPLGPPQPYGHPGPCVR